MLPTSTPEDAGMDSAQLERAFGLLGQWVEEGVLPGATALVARRGLVVARAWVGNAAKPPAARPIDAQTLFAAASVTKPFTAAAILRLVERGVVSLDQPVRELLPEFQAPGTEAITLRHCLTHTSGLPEHCPDNEAIRRQQGGLDAFVRSYCRGTPRVPPGTAWAYSNYGFGLAGEVVSRVSGRDYSTVVAEEILTPLGMRDSYLRPPEAVWDRIAWVRLPEEEASEHERFNSPYFRRLGIPWGGLYTTPDDLAVFAQAFLSGGTWEGRRILSPASVRAMRRNQLQAPAGVTAAWQAASWGLGWDVKGSKARHHSGALTSAQTFGHAEGPPWSSRRPINTPAIPETLRFTTTGAAVFLISRWRRCAPSPEGVGRRAASRQAPGPDRGKESAR
jgi:CubicO group peptidase (beta-lactamase class C family)